MSMYEHDDPDSPGNDLMYALTWSDHEGRPMYWSLHHGWTDDPIKAWVLTLSEVDGIEEDDSMVNKLPQKKEVREGAEWLPLYKRYPLYAPGVTDDDDDDTINFMHSASSRTSRTGER